ncbi:MAG: choloylglycine hydrolase family protein [Pirellulales bacterium]|nr:choloylglycine hydrolase family protein [Pirellulales bacterium]
MHQTRLCLSISLIFLCILVNRTTSGCTGTTLVAKNGAVAVGRTLEFGMPLNSHLVVHPPGTPFVGQTPNDIPGLAFSAVYGFAGITVSDEWSLIVDGTNEKGLNAAVFYFPGFAQFPPATPANCKRGVSPLQLSTWILANCATVADVKQKIDQVAVLSVYLKFMQMVPEMHYKIQDASGACITIEPIDGVLKVYDNPLRVVTNAPGFPWHITHLSNFLNLSPAYPKNKTIGQDTFAPFGLGGGLVGLPGDFTPPSRFVRMAIFTQNYPQPTNSDDAVGSTFHLLNNFDIPRGSNQPPPNTAEAESDYTSWTSVSDLQNLQIHWKTFGDPRSKMIDLKQAIANANDQSKRLFLGPQKPEASGASLDVTSQLK